MIQVKIISRKDGAFKSDTGDQIPYFWYTAERIVNGNPVRFQFGSKNGSHAEGAAELDLFQQESTNGKLVWKEA